MKRVGSFWALLLAATAAPGPLAAQMFAGAGGVEIRVGFAAPEDQGSGFSISGDLDLGYVGRPWLRAIGGVGHFGFDVESDGATVGDASSFAVRGGLRADAFPEERVSGSVLAALSFHNVSATVPANRVVQDLLDGVYVGFSLGVGGRYSLDAAGRASVVAEARRTFVTNINHWAFEGGIRYQVRGARAYVPEPAPAPPAPGAADARGAVDGASDDERAQERQERERLPERVRPRGGAQAGGRMSDAFAELARELISIAGVTETERGLVVTLGGGSFASGQATLTPEARDDVARIARVLLEFPDRDVVIEGHTDAVGGELDNRATSENRAAAVRAALIAEAIAPDRLSSIGYGESRPVSDNETPAGRASNRRVEIVVLNR
ncbi:MAG: OmpA family protein [Gemmatimonadota bacterium]